MQATIEQIRQLHGMNYRVEPAFLAVNRANYLPLQHKQLGSLNVSVGNLARTVWSVSVVNTMEPVLTDGCRVLVASAFPGYEAAVMSHLVGNNGFVVAQIRDILEANHLKEVYQYELPYYLLNGRIRVILEDINIPSLAFAPYNAIIDRKKSSHEEEVGNYFRMLAPLGMMIYFSEKQDKWVAFKRTLTGDFVYLNITIPSDRSDPHINL